MTQNKLSESHIENIKQASQQLTYIKRRAYQAQMAQKYCGSNPRQAETMFGWNRESVALGLHERRTGIACYTRSSCHERRWEHKHPEIAAVLWEIADTHSQQDPGFDTWWRLLTELVNRFTCYTIFPNIANTILLSGAGEFWNNTRMARS